MLQSITQEISTSELIEGTSWIFNFVTLVPVFHFNFIARGNSKQTELALCRGFSQL